MTKKQVLILAVLAFSVFCVLCIGGYVIISSERAYEQAIALPTSTPKPTATWTPTTRPTLTPTPVGPPPEVYAYLVETENKIGEMYDSLEEIGKLMQNARLSDDDWKLAIVVEIVWVQGKHEELVGMDVPMEMVEYHNAVLDATGDYSLAMDYMMSGIDNLDMADMDMSMQLIESGTKKFEKVTKMLDEYLAQFK
jgi:hypothetical protein